jgi:hypothetical protein
VALRGLSVRYFRSSDAFCPYASSSSSSPTDLAFRAWERVEKSKLVELRVVHLTPASQCDVRRRCPGGNYFARTRQDPALCENIYQRNFGQIRTERHECLLLKRDLLLLCRRLRHIGPYEVAYGGLQRR